MAIADWIKEATKRRRQRRRRKAYLSGFREGYNLGYADAKAGLPRLPPGSEYRSLCRLGLTATNSVSSDSIPEEGPEKGG
jgi:hypothetical protein